MIFGSKKSDNPKQPEPTPEVHASPEKAAKFFAHAKTVHDTANFEYAVQSWLGGMRWDPHSVNGLDGFAQSMAAFLNEGGRKGVSKETRKIVSGKTDLDRYLESVLEWGERPNEAALGVRAMEMAAKLRLGEPVVWIGTRAMGCAVQEKRPRKDLLVKIAELFAAYGAYDKAVVAAEQGAKIDPSDGELMAYIRELAAQATMTRGGFDKAGEAGGFRKNVRDLEKQRHLDEADRIVKTEETLDRLIAAAEQAMQERPGDLPTIERLGKLLLERATPADEERAHELYMATYERTKQFRFRELAGDIRIRQARRKVTDLQAMAEKAPGNETLARMIAQASDELLRLEVAEFRLRVEAYPTDLARKFELGKRCFAVGEYHEAITLLQEAQQDSRNRPVAMYVLGQSFERIDWIDEAIGTFRQAMEIKEISPELALELRYGLMTSLQRKAEAERDIESATEADKLASSIAVQQITFRDIRQRREAIKKLLQELRQSKA